MNDLSYIANYGSSGSGNTNLNTPLGTDTDGQYIYIADSLNHRILKWELCGGVFVSKLGGSSGSGNNEFNTPSDVLIWFDRLFVADKGNDRIKIHKTEDLSFISSFGSLDAPLSFATNGEYLFVCDANNDRVVLYDRNLSEVTTHGSNGSGSDQLDTPSQIAWDDHEGCLYVVDIGNTRIVKWLLEGTTFRQIDAITTSNSTDSSLTGLFGVTVKDHYVYVLEATRIQVFDAATLTTRTTAGSSGTGNSNIADGGYITHHRNNVIFTDVSTDRINIWYDYDPERSFTSGDTRVISGAWWQNPIVPIGGKQDRTAVTIGGTAETDKYINIEEDNITDNYANVEES